SIHKKSEITPVILTAKITSTSTIAKSNTNKGSTFNDDNKSDEITNHTNEGGTKHDANYPVAPKTMTLKKTNWWHRGRRIQRNISGSFISKNGDLKKKKDISLKKRKKPKKQKKQKKRQKQEKQEKQRARETKSK
ncbi:5553_t:CDS:1, partial [Gigaspora rosea]